MKKLFLILVIAFNFILSFHISKANKIMASDLTWTCVGQDSFLLTLTVYRDCNGDPMTSATVIASCAQSGVEITRFTASAGAAADVTPVCNLGCTRCSSSTCTFPYGINRYTFQGIVNISSAGSCCNIRFSWEQCCRNAAITTGAAGTNFYTEALLNRCIVPQDNSPHFTNLPVAIICFGQDFTFSQGVQDVDVNVNGGLADSFNFEWTDPLKSIDSAIVYTGSYAYNKPIYFWGFPNDALPFPRGIHLDNETGHIQFRPMKSEVSIMSVKLKEFRNNIQIGELRRNIQFIVVACLVNKPPVVTTPDNIKSKSVCAGDTVTFDFSTTDPDTSDTLNISWNEAITGAKWTNNNGQQKHPAATFSWVPSDAHVSSLPYTFSVTVKDNACPVRGSSTISCQVYVKPKPRANIIVIDSGGGDYWFIAQRIEGSGPVYQWEGENFTFTPNTGSVVWHKFTIPGIYPYTMEMVAGGCTNTYYDTIFFDTTNSIFETAGMEEVFIVYPNPAKEYFNIRLKDPSLLISGYKLYNASGELVKLEDEVFSREYQIACKSLEKGSYFISIRLNNGKIVNKQLVLHQ